MLAGRRSLNLSNAAPSPSTRPGASTGSPARSDGYQVSQCVTARRAAAWQAGSRCPWCRRSGTARPGCTRSNGMPRSSAACFSPSPSRCSVVQADPRPRDRSASMKLHTAGSSEPQNDALMPGGRAVGTPLQARDQHHRHLVEVVVEVLRGVEHRAASARRGMSPYSGLGQVEVRRRIGAVDIGDRLLLVGVVDEHPLPALGVGARRRLQRQLETFQQHLARHRLLEIQPLAHRAGSGQDFVDGQVQGHFARLHSRHGSRFAADLASRAQPIVITEIAVTRSLRQRLRLSGSRGCGMTPACRACPSGRRRR